MAFDFMLNGTRRTVSVPGETPLLWVLRDTLGMTGTKFGCGPTAVRRLHGAYRRRPASSCGADDHRRRRQIREIATIQGLSAT